MQFFISEYVFFNNIIVKIQYLVADSLFYV